ncbi:MAG: hypothetical protein NC548_64425 [Lachnospiraceae bacterium]|nr:hypothetical protein [Lachnospiraceae bacterium]
MAENYNKIVYGNKTLIDLTADTVTEDTLAQGITAHDKTGAIITGTSTKDSDTSDATVAVAEILVGKTAYARGAKLTGTMPDNGGFSATISSLSDIITIPMGFHDGTGTVQISDAEKAKGIPENVRDGVIFMGVEGAMSGSEGVKPQSKEVTPSAAEQVILPDEGYNYLSQVTVKAISYTETKNAAGGITVTIGA